MPELRKDPIVGRWIIVSTERARRPTDFPPPPAVRHPGLCVFCPGHESRTPPEIQALRGDGSAPDTPGWALRVVPNRFPALRIEGELEAAGEGLYDRMTGVGAHEVIVETPDHHASLARLPAGHVVEVVRAYRDRIRDLRRDERLQYVSVFKNQGEGAGASLEHPHSQLIATPIVPIMVTEELAGAVDYYRLKKRCVWCDIVRQERRDRDRLVLEEDGVVALMPFAARFPFETWILPAEHRPRYEDAPDGELAGLGRLLREVLRRVGRILGDPAYNYMLHSAPFRAEEAERFHWHLEIIPKLVRMAGFEWGTGFFINPTPPEEAARYLRGEVPGAPVS
jgi:UDPglucose--hexose-1-phosphate uridylyltransferase